MAATLRRTERLTNSRSGLRPRRDAENLARLASAMRDLNAGLRVHGVDDREAAQLPVVLDAEILARAELSTWRTDARP